MNGNVLIGFIRMTLPGNSVFSGRKERRAQQGGFWTLLSLKTGSLILNTHPCGVLVPVCYACDIKINTLLAGSGKSVIS
jgi:hypothetical protein